MVCRRCRLHRWQNAALDIYVNFAAQRLRGGGGVEGRLKNEVKNLVTLFFKAPVRSLLATRVGVDWNFLLHTSALKALQKL